MSFSLVNKKYVILYPAFSKDLSDCSLSILILANEFGNSLWNSLIDSVPYPLFWKSGWTQIYYRYWGSIPWGKHSGIPAPLWNRVLSTWMQKIPSQGQPRKGFESKRSLNLLPGSSYWAIPGRESMPEK